MIQSPVSTIIEPPPFTFKLQTYSKVIILEQAPSPNYDII